MVRVVIGDIFSSGAQTLVNTVNCVGVMGKGLALQFRKRFPTMFEDYVRRCSAGQVQLGEPYLFRHLVPPWILNFPTKDHWRSVAKLDDLARGLVFLRSHCREWEITSIAVPPLGCGEGQLEWRVVGPTLYRYLLDLDIPVDLYAPFGTPHEELELTFLEHSPALDRSTAQGLPATRIPPSWVALASVLHVIEGEPYHPPVGRTTFQKLAYFVTASGIPTKLEFRRGSYGPFSPELKSLITKLVNNGVIREERLGRMFAVHTGPAFADGSRAYSRELADWNDTIRRLADLFVRMDTGQAEVAATVHFAAGSLAQTRGGPPSESEVLAEVMHWKQKRRPELHEQEVALAIRSLGMLGWLSVRASSDLPVVEEQLLGA